MTRAQVRIVTAALAFALASPAAAESILDEAGERDPCRDVIADPIATPIRDVGLDAQRGACPRRELAAAITSHALIDTPGFRGMLGGDLALSGRMIVAGRLELGARFRVIDYAFVQNAVNKVTDVRYGPLTIGAAYGTRIAPSAHVAIVAATEVPYTRDDLDTLHAGGQLTVVFTGALATHWRLHARLGAVGAVGSSIGGDTHRIALRAGTDLVWHPVANIAFHGGAETQAGWYAGLDTVMARLGTQFRPRGGRWRGLVGVGLPLGGNERTNAILALGVARDLE